MTGVEPAARPVAPSGTTPVMEWHLEDGNGEGPDRQGESFPRPHLGARMEQLPSP